MRGQGGGPKTAKGKAASSRNAVRHGLRSGAPVIPGFESFDDWERHRSGIVASFEPEGAFETFLAGRIALLAWRLNRVPRYETEMAAHSLDDIPNDLTGVFRYGEALGMIKDDTDKLDMIAKAASRRMLPTGDNMEKIMRYEGHLHRQLIQTIRELEATQARRKGDRPSPLARLDVSGSPV
jgi:hypothetical protein